MKLVSLSIALVVLWIPVTSAGDLVMPKELVTAAAEKDCAPIHDFYDRPGSVNAPFVYGYLPGPKDDSAVFWCKKTKPDDKPYRLVIVARGSVEKNRCSDHIDWWNSPRGLAIDHDVTVSLSDFRYVDHPEQMGPGQGHPRGNVIVSSYDGVSEYFFCHKGKWLFRITH